MNLTYDHHEFYGRVKVIRDYFRLCEMGFKTHSVAGTFLDAGELLPFCEEHPEYHIVCGVTEYIIVNRYDPQGGCFKLAEGYDDPSYTLDARYALQRIMPMLLGMMNK